ncbi:PREDICTED: pumilio homolog 1-like isoform X3 [Lupinus angustifolius]|uniref:pumilio homolog 1-like isoform X3 n=1 Tax=Lupinus angustifolius TaxID=3871 RepID=UPI00092E5D39|nr:PREDICTED: pumilio homolog 1-like isoform X3 [Lupinus angustifolius]
MVSDSYQNIMSDVAIQSILKNHEYGDELGFLIERERELSRLRSGSAPPTVEGSLTAVGGLFDSHVAAGMGLGGGRGYLGSEENIRADPGYANYYYSNGANLNPRLPAPLLSKEDWRFSQQRLRGQKVGGIGDRRRLSGDEERSMFSVQPERKSAVEWGGNGDGFIGLPPSSGLGSRQKNFASVFQDEINNAAFASKQPHRPPSRNVFDDIPEESETHFAFLGQELDALQSGGNNQGISASKNHVGMASQTYASALGASLSRSTTPDPQLLPRAASPCLPPIGDGRSSSADKRTSVGQSSLNTISSGLNEPTDLVSALAGINLSATDTVDGEKHHQSSRHTEVDYNHDFNKHSYSTKLDSLSFQSHSDNQYHLEVSKSGGFGLDLNNSSMYANEQLDPRKAGGISINSYFNGPSTPTPTSRGDSPAHYQNFDDMSNSYPNYGLSGYAVNPSSPSLMASQIGSGNVPPFFDNAAAAAALRMNALDSRALGRGANLSRSGNHAASSTNQLPLMDPLYPHYLRSDEFVATQIAALNESATNRGYTNNYFTDLAGLQRGGVESLIASQKLHSGGVPYLAKAASLNHNSYRNPSYGLGMAYPGSPVAGSHFPNSLYGPGSPMSQTERNMHLTGMRNVAGGFMGAWHSDAVSSLDENFASSLLDEFKNNKTKYFELSEIAGHVVEFSADQYGSRFIQQKLETASMDEINMVFHEIMSHALSLMTDVFGNYVIQKFFEHGTEAQIRELADQLTGNVLTLSLQMYGCRVIQKAIEVVTLEQQTKMVAELDGHIMRCVRDQNGNHVIQKCIECVPEDAIHFIFSTFFDQVVTLSTHPYGCRVIQRVLEYCHDPKTQQIMMDQILQSVRMLAQDQYGNYVVQHVLEHGKPHERTAIINELTGQIVQMSQQKFASNVIEKCLSFGTPTERQALVDEMLASTDEKEPLQVLMKDQFANYVVQKVLETCDDQQLELILNRIKIHLNALKKYTYGKHIVARVEKLVAAGERRISFLTLNPAAQMV